MINKLKRIQKFFIFGWMCLSLICVNCIPFFAENIMSSDTLVDIEETFVEKSEEETEEVSINETVSNEETEEVHSEEIEEAIEGEAKEDNIEEVDIEETDEEISDDIITESSETIESSVEKEEIVESINATQEIKEKNEVVIASELEEVENEVATKSIVSVKVFWIDSINLNESGVGGSYNYVWDTFTVNEGEDFIAPENVIKDIYHSNCNQVYEFVGFTTEDQKTKYWLHADYAAGEKMFDKNFPVETDMVVWAVYNAKDTYVSSIKLVDGKLTFKNTTIPNIAIKNIIVSDKAFKNLNGGYKVLKNGNKYIAYTKDSLEGKPILEEDVKKKVNG